MTTPINEEDRLPKFILDKAIRSGNELGWRQSDFEEVIEISRQLNMAIIGGQVQYLLPDGTCELYWLSYDPAERQKSETWTDYCKRTYNECFEKFRKLISQTDIEKEAINSFEFLKTKITTGVNIGDFLIFILYFDASETDKY